MTDQTLASAILPLVQQATSLGLKIVAENKTGPSELNMLFELSRFLTIHFPLYESL